MEVILSISLFHTSSALSQTDVVIFGELTLGGKM